MSDFTSGRRNGKEIREANLQPIQPGQVLNPEGVNQYTYKRDFELTIDALLKGELSPEEAQSVPEWVQDVVSPGMTRGAALAAVTVTGALRGDSKHLVAVLKRVWPEIVKHEVKEERLQPPTFAPLENLNDEDRTLMLRLAQRAVRGGGEKPLIDEILEERKQTSMTLVRGGE
jgi:uncharacterized protein YoaH (UPF0181 family)